MVKVFWVVAFLGALAGGCQIAIGAMLANSAPQEAASAAVGLGIAAIPYVLARAVEKLRQDEPRQVRSAATAKPAR